MPELGEVAHATALLRKYILNRTLTNINAGPDELLYVKPLTNELFRQSAEQARVSNVARNGKYFMVELNGKQTLVLHFGMTGWIHVKNVGTLIRMEGGGDKKQKELMAKLTSEGQNPLNAQELATQWPPKFTKFLLTTDAGDELAFIDPRRLARVRLLDTALANAHAFEPLSKLGTDFSQRQPPASEVVPQILKRKVPVKSLLLDQAIFSGVGNWMADEILFQARLHPEQYANTLGPKHATRLYEKLLEVCRIAAETEGNSAAFPKHWLMLHRWGKSRSKKEEQRTAEGHAVSFVTVGGRTSCYVPDLQRKFRGEKNAAEDSEVKAEEPADGMEVVKKRKEVGSRIKKNNSSVAKPNQAPRARIVKTVKEEEEAAAAAAEESPSANAVEEKPSANGDAETEVIESARSKRRRTRSNV